MFRWPRGRRLQKIQGDVVIEGRGPEMRRSTCPAIRAHAPCAVGDCNGAIAACHDGMSCFSFFFLASLRHKLTVRMPSSCDGFRRRAARRSLLGVERPQAWVWDNMASKTRQIGRENTSSVISTLTTPLVEMEVSPYMSLSCAIMVATYHECTSMK